MMLGASFTGCAGISGCKVRTGWWKGLPWVGKALVPSYSNFGAGLTLLGCLGGNFLLNPIPILSVKHPPDAALCTFPSDNWAFLYAQRLALKQELPLHVCFCLVPKFLEATIRHYRFMLRGLQEVAEVQPGMSLRGGTGLLGKQGGRPIPSADGGWVGFAAP